MATTSGTSGTGGHARSLRPVAWLRRLWTAFEGPTWIVAAAVYGGWVALTLFHDRLPLAATLPIGAWLIAWHGSVQHEAIHDHPCGSRRLGLLIGFAPLALWLPYGIYRLTHLQHHNDSRLTDPFDDPESFYASRRQWLSMPRWMKRLRLFNHTLLGRLLIGPALAYASFFHAEARRLMLRRKPSRLGAWLMHIPSVAFVLIWVAAVCGMPLWHYLLIVYAGTSLVLIRSYYEHRAAERPEERTVIVESTLPFGLLFLFNNLHAAHHASPKTPWYALPDFYRARKIEILADNRGFFFQGYRQLFRRYLLKPNYMPVHPSA